MELVSNDYGEFAEHGGALDSARRRFPTAPQPWIDLSTGINPIAYPVEALVAADWTRLPDASSLSRLERTAAARYLAPAGCDVVAGPGTQAIIQRLPRLLPGRDVRIVGPTYGEYQSVFRTGDARVTVVPHAEALAKADVAIVVNPNNPDGRLVAPDDLLRLAPRVGTLVVDEAFIDASAPSQSMVPRLPATRVVVLRSFGKFYGLAGLRLGFLICPHDLGRALRTSLGPWCVGGPAIAIGTRALADDAWHATTRNRLRRDGARLAFLLGQAGAEAVGATPLFRLISHPVAPDLFRSLAAQGILVRPFISRRDWLRFGLPGEEGDWARLESALAVFR